MSRAIIHYVNYIKRLPGNEFASLYRKSSVPCYLLTLDGTHLELNCAQYFEQSEGYGVHVELLASLNIRDTKNAESADHWIKFFVCLRKAVSDLAEWYKKRQYGRLGFPFFAEIPGIETVAHDDWVEIGKIPGIEAVSYDDWIEIGKIYQATIGDKPCIVKIRRDSYGSEAHAALCNHFSDETAAPKLLHSDSSLVFGHHVVVMERLSGYTNLYTYVRTGNKAHFNEIASIWATFMAISDLRIFLSRQRSRLMRRTW